MFDFCDVFTQLFEDFSVRRNETISCLIGFGIGIGCCLLYRLITNFFSSSSSSSSIRKNFNQIETHSSSIVRNKRSRSELPQSSRIQVQSDRMTWSEISSSLSTVNLLQDSYHSNSLTADSGVDCSDLPVRYHQIEDEQDDQESLLRKYDSDTALHHDRQTATETHVMSYISTEKGLERALEQTTKFYTDLEHIASDLGTLTKRYSQSQNSLNKSAHRSIDALDWDWQDDLHSPKSSHRKQNFLSSSLPRSATKGKIRRRLNISTNQTEYNESDHECRLLDCSTSPLRKKRSSVYFGSSDNSSDEENFADETLQML